MDATVQPPSSAQRAPSAQLPPRTTGLRSGGLKTAPRTCQSMPMTPWRATQRAELQALLASLPDSINCMCEICDCGKCVHSHTCSRRPKPKTSSGEPFPQTHTHDMFRAEYVPPRSSKRPPPTPRETDIPPMEFHTNQRDDFIPRPIAMRVPVDPPKPNYDRPTDPLDGVSYYTQEFPPKKLSTPSRVVSLKHDDQIRRVNNAKFYADTTSKEHFKQWRPVTNKKVEELPCFTGDLLYPDKEKLPLSTTQQAYPGRKPVHSHSLGPRL